MWGPTGSSPYTPPYSPPARPTGRRRASSTRSTACAPARCPAPRARPAGAATKQGAQPSVHGRGGARRPGRGTGRRSCAARPRRDWPSTTSSATGRWRASAAWQVARVGLVEPFEHRRAAEERGHDDDGLLRGHLGRDALVAYDARRGAVGHLWRRQPRWARHLRRVPTSPTQKRGFWSQLIHGDRHRVPVFGWVGYCRVGSRGLG